MRGHFDPKYFEIDVEGFARAIIRENTESCEPFN